MREAVFTQVVRGHLRSNKLSTSSACRIGSNQHHLSASHRLAMLIRYAAINHGLGMQPKHQVLGVLTVPNGDANEKCAVLVVAFADVARRAGVEHIFPWLESSERKSAI